MVARKAARKMNNKNNTEQRKATAKKATEATVQSAEEVVMATEEETVEGKAVETVEKKDAVEEKEDRREESSKKSSSEKGDEDFCSSRIQGKTGRRKRDDRGSEKSVDKIWTSDR